MDWSDPDLPQLLDRQLRQVEHRYRRIARDLDPLELRSAPDTELREQDLAADPQDEGSELFVGYYTEAGLLEALRRYGFWAELAQRLGVPDSALTLRTDTRDRFHHSLRIYAEGFAEEVVELRLHLRERPLTLVLPPPPGGGYVCCEWLSLQHPGAAFHGERPPLPGQRHPGLGLGGQAQTLLMLLTERVGRLGLLAYPAWAHAAFMYGLRFRAVDPQAEGWLRALRRDAAGLSLAEVSWAVELGCARDLSSRHPGPLLWTAPELLLPLSAETRAYLETPAYQDACAEAESRHRFAFDLAKLRGHDACPVLIRSSRGGSAHPP